MNLKNSILKTIQFFDIFDYPLKAEEIQRYLYQRPKALHIKEVKGTLAGMSEIVTLKEYYLLKGREEIIRTREGREFRSEQYWNKVKFYGLHMRRVPFIKMIAVCNNLSYHNASEKSDIDLLIVTTPGRLWTARILLTLLLQFFGVRRHGDKIAGRFCLSFFITTERLNFEPIELSPVDPYLAYWMTLLAPIEGREIFAELREKNKKWLSEKYGLEFSLEQEKHFYTLPEDRLKKILEWLLGGFLGNLFEKSLSSVFKKRAQKKAAQINTLNSGIVIEDNMLKFHDLDRRSEYAQKWLSYKTPSV